MSHYTKAMFERKKPIETIEQIKAERDMYRRTLLALKDHYFELGVRGQDSIATSLIDLALSGGPVF